MGSLLKFRFNHLVIPLECWIFYWTTVYSHAVSVTFPKIGIADVHQGHYYMDVGVQEPNLNVTFQNETVYVLPSAIGELTIDCNASYPIMWNLAGSEINAAAFSWIRVRSRRLSSDVYDPSTFNYSTQLILSAPGESHRLTGNYSCQSTANNKIQSNIFIFWEGPYSFAHARETISLSIEDASKFVLPCGITSPSNAWPKLRKELSRGRQVYQDLKINSSISFKTTKGFILQNLPDPFGKYKCFYGDGTRDFVIINVKQRNATQLALKNLKSNATFTYDAEKNEVVCCSSSKRPPRLVFLSCEHAVTCQIREHILQSYHYIFSRSKKKSSCAIKALHFYHTGLIRCMGDGIDEYKEVITPIQKVLMPWNMARNVTTKTFFRWEEIESQDMLVVRQQGQPIDFNQIILNSPSQPIYTHQPITLECHTSNYYFSEGVQWSIKWKNKTVTPSSNTDEDSTVGNYYVYARMSNVLQISGDKDMDAVICFAPVWNSSVFVTKSYFLYINESIIPALKNSEAQEFTWYTNETNKILTCEASGSPDPTIIWEKDGKSIPETAHNYNISTSKDNSNNLVTSNLKILRVAYSTHGEFSCSVNNYGGFVSRTFRITVAERGSWGTATVLIVSGIVICIILGITFFLLHKMMEDKKVIQHLTSVHFKDPSTRENVIGTDINNAVHDNGKMTNQLIS